MRIRDCSSDVCSSDLSAAARCPAGPNPVPPSLAPTTGANTRAGRLARPALLSDRERRWDRHCRRPAIQAAAIVAVSPHAPTAAVRGTHRLPPQPAYPVRATARCWPPVTSPRSYPFLADLPALPEVEAPIAQMGRDACRERG